MIQCINYSNRKIQLKNQNNNYINQIKIKKGLQDYMIK